MWSSSWGLGQKEMNISEVLFLTQSCLSFLSSIDRQKVIQAFMSSRLKVTVHQQSKHSERDFCTERL